MATGVGDGGVERTRGGAGSDRSTHVEHLRTLSILPHLAYGLVTAATYGLMENGRTRTPPLRNRRKNKKARALPR